MTDDARRRAYRRRMALGLAAGALVAAVVVAGVALWRLRTPEAPPCAPEEGEAAAPDESDAAAGVQAVVYKGRRQLILFRDGLPPKTFHVALGGDPVGDKERQGDGRTPVGTFYVSEKNLKSKYYLFIGLSYPNEEDASRGLRDGLISAAESDAILRALDARKSPPWYTRLGGEIGFHGGGAAWDWTQGCIALENADMRELYAALRVGMSVTIEP